MEFGLMVEPQVGGTYEDLLRLAKWADTAGIAAFARSDHYLNGDASAPASDALTSFGGLARETERIQLVSLVSPITFRHPAVMAKSAVTIDEMSGGRMALGVGTGWMESEHEAFGLELPPMAERFELLYDALAYLRAALGKAPRGFHGRHYALADIEVLPKPTGDLPLVVGGSGTQKTPRLAGQFADEFNTFVQPVADLEPRLAVMRQAAIDADRDPDAILVSMVSGLFVGETEAEYRDLIAETADARGITADEMEARLAARNFPRGTPEQVRSGLDALAAAGVGRYYAQYFEPLDAISTQRLDYVFGVLGG